MSLNSYVREISVMDTLCFAASSATRSITALSSFAAASYVRGRNFVDGITLPRTSQGFYYNLFVMYYINLNINRLDSEKLICYHGIKQVLLQGERCAKTENS